MLATCRSRLVSLYVLLHLQVFQAFDGQRICAIKYVNLEEADDFIVQSYINEVQLLERLQGNDNIVKLFDWWVQALSVISHLYNHPIVRLCRMCIFAGFVPSGLLFRRKSVLHRVFELGHYTSRAFYQFFSSCLLHTMSALLLQFLH